jgi:hypothetical protein
MELKITNISPTGIESPLMTTDNYLYPMNDHCNIIALTQSYITQLFQRPTGLKNILLAFL